MATSFPTGLDTFVDPVGTNPLTAPDHAGQHTNINDAVAALEAKVGVNSSAVTTSLDYKISQAAAAGVANGFLRTAASTMTVHPWEAVATTSYTTGFTFLTFFTCAASITTSQIRFSQASTGGANANSGIGLYSVDASDNCTLIASVTGSTVFGGTGMITKNWASSVAVTAGSRYAVGFLCLTTAPTFNVTSTTLPSTLLPEMQLQIPRYNAASAGSQTVLPATITAASMQTTTGQIYAVIL